MRHWYIVKRNWPQTAASFPEYAGFGGEVWPLDEHESVEARQMHASFMESREHVDVGDSSVSVCTNLAMARRYANLAEELLGSRGRVWLLRVGLEDDDAGDGFDIGSPSGGYSVVETEIIHGRREGDLGDFGLFGSRKAAQEYLAARADPALEDMDSAHVFQIEVLPI